MLWCIRLHPLTRENELCNYQVCSMYSMYVKHIPLTCYNVGREISSPSSIPSPERE